MLKRIALMILGLLLAGGAFLAYQRLTGANFLARRTPDEITIVPDAADDRPKTYESRRPTGELEYILSAKKFEPATDPNGNPLPGQFVMTEPAAKYYTSDGRLITMHAKTGTVAIDQSVSGKKTRFIPRGGRLSGDVTITFGPQESDESIAANPGTISVKLTRDLEFDNVQRVLSSPGEIHVRSSQVAFDGEDLTIAFNPDQQRLEYFRIEKGNKILVKDVDEGTLALNDNAPAGKGALAATTTTTTTAPATGPALAAAGAATQAAPAKASRVPTAYKLSFGQNVAASLGSRTLTSDRLYVLFMAAANDVEQKEKKNAEKKPDALPAAAAPVAPAAPPVPAATILPATEPVAPVPAPRVEDLVITWTGPMEMRPTGPDDLQLAGAKDKALEAVGTVERPVELHDATRLVTAGRLWLHAGEKRVEIEPGEVGFVKLADSTKGTATCMGLSYVRDSNHLKLAGPGKLEVSQGLLRRNAAASTDANGRPLTISWQRLLDLDLIDLPDPKKPGKNNVLPAVRRAVLTGLARIDDPTFQLASDTLDVLVANTADPASPQAIEHLLATGNVSIKSFRNDKTGIAREPEGLTSQRLELLTSAGPAGGAPVPSKLLVDGDVAAWSFRNDKNDAKTETVAVSTTGKAPKPPAKQTIYAPHLEIALAPKPKSADTAGQTGAIGMGDYEATRFVASGGDAATLPAETTSAVTGVKIELENYAPHLITATAQSLEALPASNQATLLGSAAAPVKVAFADNTISGQRIELDQNKKSFHIPGKGEFVFTLPANKDRKQPTPMQVRWEKEMTFDSEALLATFQGDTVAQMTAAKGSDSSTLTANTLQVKLKNAKGQNGAADLAGNLAGSSDLALDTITASGNVKANGGQMAADDTPITRMYLTTERLVYDDNTHTLTIPVAGAMSLEDYRPEKANAGGMGGGRGQTAFKWDGDLIYDQRANTVELIRGVHMVHVPKKAIAVAGNKAGAGSRIELNTEHLLAKLSQVKNLTGATSIDSTVGVGNDGNQQLDNVRADHGAVLTMDTKQELHADTLTYDNNTHMATANGTNDSQITFIDPDKQLIHATQLTWDMANDKVAVRNPGGAIRLE
jgi:hypothetical protein